MLNKIKTYFLLLGVVFLGVCGCDDGLELQDEVAWKKVCTKWGTSSSKVKEMMRTYSIKKTSSDIITYKGKYPVSAISYQFSGDSLCAVALVIDAVLTDKAKIQSSFIGYESLGEFDSNELYVDYKTKTLVTLTSYMKNQIEYYSVGYADLGNIVVDVGK